MSRPRLRPRSRRRSSSTTSPPTCTRTTRRPLPGVFLEPVPDALRSLVARWARGRGPFTTAQVSAWFGVDVEEELRGLEREEKLVRGELRPGGSEREWCDPDVLRRLRRASLAALRRQVE